MNPLAKLTTYSPTELRKMFKTKMFPTERFSTKYIQPLDKDNIKVIRELLSDIQYETIYKVMAKLTKKQLKGKTSKKEDKQLDELIERSSKQYFRMKGWFIKFAASLAND